MQWLNCTAFENKIIFFPPYRKYNDIFFEKETITKQFYEGQNSYRGKDKIDLKLFNGIRFYYPPLLYLNFLKNRLNLIL